MSEQTPRETGGPQMLTYPTPGPVFERPDEAAAENVRAFDRLVTGSMQDSALLERGLRNFVPVYHTLDWKPVPELPDAWPSWLFVPGQARANWRLSWSFGDPGPEQFYSNAWSHSSPSWLAQGNVASKEQGTLFARAVGAQTGLIWNQAGLGAIYRSPYTLAEVSIEPTIVASMSRTWNVQATQGAPTIVSTHELASIDVAAWEINAVDGTFALLYPFTHVILNDTDHSGLGGIGIVTTNQSYTGPQAAATFLAQRGKSYLVSVIADARLELTIAGYGDSGPLPPSLHFDLWIRLACSVPRIEVQPRHIYKQ